MIGIIGCGNMAQAIVKGYHAKDKTIEFVTYTPSYTRAKELADAVDGYAVKSLSEFNKVSTIVIACKPQQFADLAVKLADSDLDLKKIHFISILAATSIDTIQKRLGATHVTRVMPNTPALIGLGMSLIIHAEQVCEDEKKLTHNFFESVGKISLMPDELSFDQVTTVSGSGPAYVFLFAQTMADKLEDWGLSAQESRKIVIELFKGSSSLMSDQDDLSLEELVSKVTSRGGVTIEAVKEYKKGNLSAITSDALDAAFNRSKQMTNEFK